MRFLRAHTVIYSQMASGRLLISNPEVYIYTHTHKNTWIYIIICCCILIMLEFLYVCQCISMYFCGYVYIYIPQGLKLAVAHSPFASKFEQNVLNCPTVVIKKKTKTNKKTPHFRNNSKINY
jgi:hypothetical protein